jgi:uncharacterized protein Smg (DUF494 family)
MVMKQNIVEVIAYLLEMANSQTIEAADSLSDMMIIQKRLQDAGFSQKIVTRAFDWLKELIEQQYWYAVTKVDNNKKADKTMRIFTSAEEAHINKEIRGFILSLEYASILDMKMREIVISQLMQLNQRIIELPDAKLVVLLVLMSKLNKNIQTIRSYFLATTTLGT